MVWLRRVLSSIDPMSAILVTTMLFILAMIYCGGRQAGHVSVLETKQEEAREAVKEATKEYDHATKEIRRAVRNSDARALRERILRGAREINAQEASSIPLD